MKERGGRRGRREEGGEEREVKKGGEEREEGGGWGGEGGGEVLYWHAKPSLISRLHDTRQDTASPTELYYTFFSAEESFLPSSRN